MSLLQHHSSKASILRRSAFLMIQLSHLYMTAGKTIALTTRIFAQNTDTSLISFENPRNPSPKVLAFSGTYHPRPHPPQEPASPFSLFPPRIQEPSPEFPQGSGSCSLPSLSSNHPGLRVPGFPAPGSFRTQGSSLPISIKAIAY